MTRLRVSASVLGRRAAEITYLMQNLNQTMPLNQFQTELTNFTAQLANPSLAGQQKFGNTALQQELLASLNQYHYAANFNAAGYPAELVNFVLLRGYDDLNKRYAEFLRLKDSAIGEEQAGQAFKNSSGEISTCFRIARNVPSGISPG